jgi:hypothetical protein
MNKQKHIIAIVILGIALAVAFVVVAGVPWGYRATAPSQKIGGNTAGQNPGVGATASSSPLVTRTYVPHPPHGSVTYQIAQAATQLPGFAQATIDPADASVGQVQKFVIVTNDSNPVTSVVAVITTDHKTITVPLVSQGAPAVSMLVPRTMYVGSDDQLAIVAPGSIVPDIAKTEKGAHVANAANSDDTEFTGQWTVEDTHAAKYQTAFLAKDSAGNENSVTLQWTDPCPFVTVDNYAAGTATISASCIMNYTGSQTSPVDGVENGNLLVASGTMTIENGNTLIINGGYTIKFSGNGAISLQSTAATILFGYGMYGTDNDGDGWAAGTQWSTTQAGGMISRANIANGIGDCDDADVSAYPGSPTLSLVPEILPSGQTTSSMIAADPAFPWDFNCDDILETAPNTTFTGTMDGSTCITGPPGSIPQASSSCDTYWPEGCGQTLVRCY